MRKIVNTDEMNRYQAQLEDARREVQRADDEATAARAEADRWRWRSERPSDLWTDVDVRHACAASDAWGAEARRNACREQANALAWQLDQYRVAPEIEDVVPLAEV